MKDNNGEVSEWVLKFNLKYGYEKETDLELGSFLLLKLNLSKERYI